MHAVGGSHVKPHVEKSMALSPETHEAARVLLSSNLAIDMTGPRDLLTTYSLATTLLQQQNCQELPKRFPSWEV